MSATNAALAALTAATAVGFAAFSVAQLALDAAGERATAPGRGRLQRRLDYVRNLWIATIDDQSPADRASRRKLTVAGFAGGVLLGSMLLGWPGIVLGGLAGPWALRTLVAARRRRFARRIDDGSADLAQALAAALAGGNSVRGALLACGASLQEPLASEIDRLAVDLVVGQSVEDALIALRERTGSARVEAIAGAIELHRNSGGDLVELMRELSAAFRERDVARRDARAATAQARFTAIVVAAIPLTLALVAELASPGSVSGAFMFPPAAFMMVVAIALLAGGGVACARIGRVR